MTMTTLGTEHQTKHKSEEAARKAARALADKFKTCCIVQSYAGGHEGMMKGEKPIFYLEAPNQCGFTRNWERLVFEGKTSRV